MMPGITEKEIEKFAREQGLPKQGLLDYMSRMDELLIANLKQMRHLELTTNLVIPRIKRLSLDEMKKRLESGQEVPYEVKEIDMTSARTDEPITIEGDHITAQVSGGGTLAGVTIRFNMQKASPVPMEFFNPWKQQFFQIFLTHTAQAGQTLYLAIGREASSETQSFSITAELKNKISAVVDSTIATLLGTITYTGTAFSVEEYGRIIGSCYADVAGTLYIDQRNDGVNWDVRETIVYPAGGLMGFTVEAVANEARLVYTNGAVNQAAFRLYARLRRL